MKFKKGEEASEEAVDCNGLIDNIEDIYLAYLDSGFLTLDAALETAKCIRQAKDLKVDGKYSEAVEKACLGLGTVSRIIYSKNILWRFVYIQQGPLFLFYSCFGIALLSFSLTELENSKEISLQTYSAFGSLGAVLRGMWYLYHQVCKRNFRSCFIFSHLIAPIMGAIFGVICLFMIKAGVVIAIANKSTEADPKIVLPLVILAGFSWEWVIDKLEVLKTK